MYLITQNIYFLINTPDIIIIKALNINVLIQFFFKNQRNGIFDEESNLLPSPYLNYLILQGESDMCTDGFLIIMIHGPYQKSSREQRQIFEMIFENKHSAVVWHQFSFSLQQGHFSTHNQEFLTGCLEKDPEHLHGPYFYSFYFRIQERVD